MKINSIQNNTGSSGGKASYASQGHHREDAMSGGSGAGYVSRGHHRENAVSGGSGAGYVSQGHHRENAVSGGSGAGYVSRGHHRENAVSGGSRAGYVSRGRYRENAISGAVNQERVCEKERHNVRQNNYDNINTSIKSNPDARVSFKGNKVPLLHKFAEYAYNNPLAAEAVCATFWAGILRPASVMAMARDESEKEKCKYQAAKSIASAGIGLFSTVFVGTVVSAGTGAAMKKGILKIPQNIKATSQQHIDKGIEVLNEIAQNIKGSNPKLSNQISLFTKPGRDEYGKPVNQLNLNIFGKKGENTIDYFKGEIQKLVPENFETIDIAIKKQKVVNKYSDTAKEVTNRLFQPIWMPIRAFITMELVTPIVKYFGIIKPDNKNKEIEQKMFNTLNQNIFQDEHSMKIFQPFYNTSEAA